MNTTDILKGTGIAILPPDPIKISVCYEWIIEKLKERCSAVPQEIIDCLRGLDKEQGIS